MRINWKLGKDEWRRVNRRAQGSFTVFFSMLLVSILLFVVVLFSMSRHFLAVTHGKRALDTAAAAVLAGYNEDLAKRYGLMGIESEEQLLDSLRYFLKKNYRVDAARRGREGIGGGVRYALQQVETKTIHRLGETEEFVRQLERFMKIRVPAGLIREISTVWRDAGTAVSGGGILDDMQALQERALAYNAQFAELVSWVDGIGGDGSRKDVYVNRFPGEGWDVSELIGGLDGLLAQWKTAKVIPLDIGSRLAGWISRLKLYEGVCGKAEAAWRETVGLGREVAAQMETLRKQIGNMEPEEQASELVRQAQKQMEELEPSLHQGSGEDERITKALSQNSAWLQNAGESLCELENQLSEPRKGLEDSAEKAKKAVEALTQYHQDICLTYEIHSGEGNWSWTDLLEALSLYAGDLRPYAPDTPLLEREDQRCQRLPSVQGALAEAPDTEAEDSFPLIREAGEGLLRKIYLSVYTTEQLTNLEETIRREAGEKAANLRGVEKEAGFFRNEAEYILHGSMNEYRNVQAVKGKLLFVRTVLNMLHLGTDPEKQGMLHAIADTVGGIVAPGIGNTVLYGAILLLWSTWEANADYHCLLEGEKVPLFKSAADWRTDLESLLRREPTEKTPEEGRGLGYGQYLRFLLLWMNEETWMLRLQDVIQLDIEKATGKFFQLSSVTTEFQAAGRMKTDGREYEFKGCYGYE